jgi:hypothetical protein
MDLAVDDLNERMAPLIEADAVVLVDGRLLVRAPATVVAQLISASTAQATRATERLQEIAGALPHLSGGPTVGDAPAVADPIDGEINYGNDWLELMRNSLRNTVGDVLWLRPDQWRQPWEGEMHRLVTHALAAGRTIRAIYPVRVLVDAPEVVHARSELGEQIRLLPEVPTRMVVLGTALALLPEPLGFNPAPRSEVRQRGLVELAALTFDLLWDQATPLPGDPAADADALRGFLLAELARGAQDEQIARRLGISLRTVRRRVAVLMDELGAQSRFQAGVEAARRGWV